MPSPKPASRAANDAAKYGGISSKAVAKASGKTWSEWIELLDSIDATNLPHKEIALHLYEKYKVPGWWCQMITVGYEQAKGRRVVGQKCTGDFAANGSKTLPISAEEAHAWFADTRKRNRWLEKSITLRTATAPKSARLQFPDGSIAGAWITPKGPEKCSVGISHDKLPDAKTAAKQKAFWNEALTKLAEVAS